MGLRETFDIISAQPMQMLISVFRVESNNDRLLQYIELIMAFYEKDKTSTK